MAKVILTTVRDKSWTLRDFKKQLISHSHNQLWCSAGRFTRDDSGARLFASLPSPLLDLHSFTSSKQMKKERHHRGSTRRFFKCAHLSVVNFTSAHTLLAKTQACGCKGVWGHGLAGSWRGRENRFGKQLTSVLYRIDNHICTFSSSAIVRDCNNEVLSTLPWDLLFHLVVCLSFPWKQKLGLSCVVHHSMPTANKFLRAWKNN